MRGKRERAKEKGVNAIFNRPRKVEVARATIICILAVGSRLIKVPLLNQRQSLAKYTFRCLGYGLRPFFMFLPCFKRQLRPLCRISRIFDHFVYSYTSLQDINPGCKHWKWKKRLQETQTISAYRELKRSKRIWKLLPSNGCDLEIFYSPQSPFRGSLKNTFDGGEMCMKFLFEGRR